MIRRWFWFLFMLMVASSSVLAMPAAQDDCPGAPPVHLKVGAKGVVVSGQANNVREQPTKNSKFLGRLKANTIFDISQGPVCAEGMNWWFINTPNLNGWSAEGQGEEYWLAPYVPDTVSNPGGKWTVIDHQPIHFTVSRALASGVRIEPILARGDSNPAGTRFTLTGYPGASSKDKPAKATLQIYRTDDFGGYGYGEIDELNGLLNNQPVTFDDAVPVVPQPAGTQMLHAKVAYVNPTNGRGVRFITYYAQGNAAATNRVIYYQFMGITSSGYLINGQFPLNSTILAGRADLTAPGDDMLYNQWETYRGEVVTTLNGQRDNEFTPDLGLLDALVQSIQVEG